MKVSKLMMAGLLCASSVALMAGTADDDAAAARMEARQRISPVIDSVWMSDEVPTCGARSDKGYDVNWSVIAYGEDYNTSISFFDCTESDNDAYKCGAHYSDANRIGHDVQAPYKVEVSNWKYNASNGQTVYAYRFMFHTTIWTPPYRHWEGDGSDHGPWGSVEDNNASKIVIRFYQKDDLTTTSMPGIAVLIAARAKHSYGLYSRRVYNYLATDVDPNANPPVCAWEDD